MISHTLVKAYFIDAPMLRRVNEEEIGMKLILVVAATLGLSATAMACPYNQVSASYDSQETSTAQQQASLAKQDRTSSKE